MSPLEPCTIVGIDPGTKRIGYGVVVCQNKTFTFKDAGLLIPNIRQAKPKSTLLASVHDGLNTIVQAHHPNIIAIERVYFGHNVSSAFAVSEVRGALTLTAHQLHTAVIDVHPTNVKQVVCGYGHADKTAVRKMVFQSVEGIPKSLKSRDAVDALAIAIAGYYAFKSQALIDKA